MERIGSRVKKKRFSEERMVSILREADAGDKTIVDLRRIHGFKLCQSAQRGFQRLNGSELIVDVLAGIQFENGVKKQAA